MDDIIVLIEDVLEGGDSPLDIVKIWRMNFPRENFTISNKTIRLCRSRTAMGGSWMEEGRHRLVRVTPLGRLTGEGRIFER